LAGQKTCNIFKSERFARLRYLFDITALYIILKAAIIADIAGIGG